MKEELLQKHSTPEVLDYDKHLYVYAIIRKDLEMPPGKLSSQAGHAYGDALSLASELCPDLYNRYRNNDNGGSKVTLSAKNENQILNAYMELKELGIPCSIVVDRNHIMLPHFDGSPIITALGVGPCTKDQTKHILKKFRCV